MKRTIRLALEIIGRMIRSSHYRGKVKNLAVDKISMSRTIATLPASIGVTPLCGQRTAFESNHI
jgi:hypothetical protein